MQAPRWREALKEQMISLLADEKCASFADYLEKQAAEYTFGSSMELRVAQHLYKRRINLYHEERAGVGCSCCSFRPICTSCHWRPSIMYEYVVLISASRIHVQCSWLRWACS